MQYFDDLPAPVRSAIANAPYKIRAETIWIAIQSGTPSEQFPMAIELEMRRLLNLNAVA